MPKEVLKVRVYRHGPTGDEAPSYVNYEVPRVREGLQTVMGILEYIYENLDPGLAFYRSCRAGCCGGCRVTINGKKAFACMSVVNEDVSLEPCKGYKVIRDLVVDFRTRKKE